MNNPTIAARVEDALTYLPRKPLQEFSRGSVIYGLDRPSTSLYLVVAGRVKTSSISDDGCQTVLRIVPAEGLFGHSALLGLAGRPEQAVALDHSHVMAWTADEIELQIEREPKLGLALCQDIVAMCIDLQQRIDSMAFHKTPERVMVALLQLASAIGENTADGLTRVPGLTHHTIAEYVGTSREIVTSQMNRLRRQGMLKYTRRFIDVDAPAMDEALRTRNHTPPLAADSELKVRTAGGG